jgi:DNA-binding NtrC family response regulator
LTSYNWPGNIRELKNVVENMVVLCEGEVITKDNIPVHILEAVPENIAPRKGGLEETVKHYERQLIIKALQKAAGNITQAARSLEIPRSTLYYKIEQHGIDVNNLT